MNASSQYDTATSGVAFDEIDGESSERCGPGSDRVPRMYRAPDRLVVQLGAAGSSISRTRSATDVPAETSLLVIERKRIVSVHAQASAVSDPAAA